MSKNSHSLYTIVLLGRKASLKLLLLRGILGKDEYSQIPSDCVLGESSHLRVISAPNVFSEEVRYPDQHLIDIMALSLPGPHLFLLAVDRDGATEARVSEQIRKLQSDFGEGVCRHLVVALPDIESYHALRHLQERFGTTLTTANENLASDCRKWCRDPPFSYSFHNYIERVVRRRRDALLRNSDSGAVEYFRTVVEDPYTDLYNSLDDTGPSPVPAPGVLPPAVLPLVVLPPVVLPPAVPPEIPPKVLQTEVPPPVPERVPISPGAAAAARSVLAPPPGPPQAALQAPPPGTRGTIFNPNALFFHIVILGSSGTGKSASGNTILAAAKSKSRFKSTMSSDPVTVEIMAESVHVFGTRLTVVDTPDFLHEKISNVEAQVAQCRRFLVPGHFVVLLVLKVDRFREPELLERLERQLGVSLRDDTFLLMTHGEELKGRQSEFFNTNRDLQKIADQVQYRSHVFNNRKRDPEQVISLLRKIPYCEQRFPQLPEQKSCQTS